MKEKVRFVLFFILFIFIFNFVSAVSIDNSLHLNIQTTNATGAISGTFVFVFNITTASDCSGVVYTNSTTLTTDSRGVISYYLGDVNLDFSNQYWLCYYRDGTLISASKIARAPYSFRAKNTSISGLDIDSGLNLGNYDLTALNGIFGNATFSGGWLSNGVSILGGDIFAKSLYVYNISSLSVNNLNINGSMSPYFDNQFDIGSSSLRWNDIFLGGQISSDGLGNNYLLGKLGVGTNNPTSELSVNGNGNFSGTIYINGNTDVSTLGGGTVNYANIAFTNRSEDWGTNNVTAFWFFGNLDWIYLKNLPSYVKDWNSTGLIANWSTGTFTETDPYWAANYSAYNSSWSSITNTSYYLATNPFGFYNSTTLPANSEPNWNVNYSNFLLAYNYSTNGTYATFNEPLWTSNLTAYNDSWLNTTNTTYNAYNSTGLIKDWNSSGLIINWSGATTTVTGNPFDQSLNTTDSVTFNQVNSTGMQGVSFISGAVAGTASLAAGAEALAGTSSFAFGNGARAGGANSFATGQAVYVLGSNSFGAGTNIDCNGYGDICLGYGLSTGLDYAMGISLNNPDPSQWSLTQSNTLAIFGGNVGIGIGTPSAVLELSNSSGGVINNILKLDTTGNAALNSGVGILFNAPDSSNFSDAGKISVAREGSILNSYMSFSVQNGTLVTEKMRITSNGNVGIGTTNPSSLLTIGKVAQTNEVNLSGILYVNSTSTNVGIGTSSPNTTLQVRGGNGIYTSSSDKGIISYGTNYDFYGGNSLADNYFAGNVSIGTTNSNYKFEIAPSAKALNISGNLYVNSTSVAIGGSGLYSPSILYINGNDGGNPVVITHTGTGLVSSGGLCLWDCNHRIETFSGSGIFINDTDKITLTTQNGVGGTGNIVLLPKSGGRVGISSALTVGNGETLQAYNSFGASPSPSSGQITTSDDVYIKDDLEVDGTAYIGATGGTVGAYWTVGDLAENLQTMQGRESRICGDKPECQVYSKDDLNYGDVVCIDSRMGGIIMRCNESNSRLVVGVVSNTSKIQVGEMPKDSYPVGVAGIVFTKVTTENGVIYPGDLLVSASREGYAMRSDNPAQGTVLGKAFDFCDGSHQECIIPMFVALG